MVRRDGAYEYPRNGKDIYYTNFDDIGSDGMREVAAILKKVSKSLKIKFVEDEE